MTVAGNYEKKYQSTHPVKRWLVNRFVKAFKKELVREEFQTVLDAGCGEGDLLQIATQLKPKTSFVAFDLSAKTVSVCQKLNPKTKVVTADIYRLPFAKNRFDLVIGCEILEHLEQPLKGLKELVRVGKKHFLITVPLEPWWRILNLARFKYVTDLGNTPGHLQHFSPTKINQLINQADLRVNKLEIVFPWIFVSATK